MNILTLSAVSFLALTLLASSAASARDDPTHVAAAQPAAALEPYTVHPDNCWIRWGKFVRGVVEDLFFSDDAYFVVQQRASFSPLVGAVDVEVEGTARGDTASALTVTMEASCSARPPAAPQKLMLWDYDLGNWEIIDQRMATTSDSVVQVTITTNPDRFIQPGTRSMQARLGWYNPGNVFLAAWQVNIDQAIWTVNP